MKASAETGRGKEEEEIMLWQDLVLMVGNFVIVIALIPTVLGKHKPEPLTSFLDGVVLTAFAIVFFSLGLYCGAIAVSISGLLWFILLVQVLIIKRNRRR